MKYVFMQVHRHEIIKSSAPTTGREKNAFNRRVCAAWTEVKNAQINISQSTARERRMEIKVIFLRAAVGCITSSRYFLRRAGAAVQLPETFCSWSEDKHGKPCVCVCVWEGVITATSAILHSEMSMSRSVTPGLAILCSEMQFQPDWKDLTPPGKQAALRRGTNQN